MENKCVCCGADIPEGRLACPTCELKASNRAYKALQKYYEGKAKRLAEMQGENKGRCKWYKDEVCVNADCPYVADFCPVAQDDSICKFRG
jgi:hypothetical protein